MTTLTILQLGPENRSLSPRQVAHICGYDREYLLRYLWVCEQQAISWSQSAEDATGPNEAVAHRRVMTCHLGAEWSGCPLLSAKVGVMTTAYDFTAHDIDGNPVALSTFTGLPLLVVNTASKCGFTPQYKGLEELSRKYADQGLRVLGFPCDQFGHQEPGDADEIKNFCSLTYDVSFPMFAKINVNGPDAHPLYEWLRSQKKGVLGGRIKWNFTKFLIDRNGVVVNRFAPATTPAKLTDEIVKVL